MDKQVLLEEFQDLSKEFQDYVDGFDFCGSRLDDAFCECVSPRGPEFVSDWLNSRGFALVDLEDENLELVLALSGLVLAAFIRFLTCKVSGDFEG